MILAPGLMWFQPILLVRNILVIVSFLPYLINVSSAQDVSWKHFSSITLDHYNYFTTSVLEL